MDLSQFIYSPINGHVGCLQKHMSIQNLYTNVHKQANPQTQKVVAGGEGREAATETDDC